MTNSPNTHIGSGNFPIHRIVKEYSLNKLHYLFIDNQEDEMQFFKEIGINSFASLGLLLLLS
jgi:hypothetical protein